MYSSCKCANLLAVRCLGQRFVVYSSYKNRKRQHAFVCCLFLSYKCCNFAVPEIFTKFYTLLFESVDKALRYHRLAVLELRCHRKLFHSVERLQVSCHMSVCKLVASDCHFRSDVILCEHDRLLVACPCYRIALCLRKRSELYICVLECAFRNLLARKLLVICVKCEICIAVCNYDADRTGSLAGSLSSVH